MATFVLMVGPELSGQVFVVLLSRPLPVQVLVVHLVRGAVTEP